MRVYKIIKNTSVEGPGKRFCIWFQGCSRHCKGCMAKDTWDFFSGSKYSVTDIYKMIKAEPDIEGVTFLGGEPFEQAKEVSQLAALIKRENLSIVCFTGFKIEELKSKDDKYINALLQNIDLLIDSPFEESNLDLSRPWVGSSNQRYIFLTDRYSESEILKYKNKVEMRISPNGSLVINGMGDFAAIKQNFIYNNSKI